MPAEINQYKFINLGGSSSVKNLALSVNFAAVVVFLNCELWSVDNKLFMCIAFAYLF